MIINDLSLVETVLENETVLGGTVVAIAGAGANSRGRNFAGVFTDTFTSTFSGRFFKSASARSVSESGAD
ncbi:hypothetical protein ANSO36C_14230 [Nostoc cf. commune SO-36]|uniref:Uncharacterized protein n=1 Tax=Nostoc cf. commune SO-36 TaxID=449208 RepID=A0ABM7YY54_NOSCO|nr:hypothetical protein [Nostoc commune]BDI15621.1 hypothetical protein ANSO36C_14230 [Nostoc cf. commune SO-36]